MLHFGSVPGVYSSSVNVGANTTYTVPSLTPGQKYYYVVTAYNSSGQSADSNVITNIAPLQILTQPLPQTVVVGCLAVLSVTVSSVAPVTFQWYFNGAPIAGATKSTLILPASSASTAGSYQVMASNGGGSVWSQVATVSLLDPAIIPELLELAVPSGAYSGLFYQTNSSGNSVVAEATTGLLSKCTVGLLGVYSAQLAVAGQTFAISGVSLGGEIKTTIDRSALGLPNLKLSLYADSALNSGQLTGVVSNMSSANPWVSLVTATLATSAYPSQSLVFKSPPPPGKPQQNWFLYVAVTNAVAILAGQLGDGTTISQSSPIGVDGSFPVYQSLYSRQGLLAGSLTLVEGTPVGNLTWISPGTTSQAGFNTVVSFGAGSGLSTNHFQLINP